MGVFVIAPDLRFCDFLDLLPQSVVDSAEHCYPDYQSVYPCQLGCWNHTVDLIPYPLLFRAADMSGHVIHQTKLGPILLAHKMP